MAFQKDVFVVLDGRSWRDTSRTQSNGVVLITQQLAGPCLRINDVILSTQEVSCWGIDLLGFYRGEAKSGDEVKEDKGGFNPFVSCLGSSKNYLALDH